MPEAPLAGAEKVTLAPETGLPNWSTSWTWRAVPKAAPTVALWLFPATMVMLSPVVLATTVGDAVPQVAVSFLAVMVGVPAVWSP